MNKITRLSASATMKWKITNLKTLLYLITAFMLMVGLGSAILIYLTTENGTDSFLVNEAIGGYAHSIALEDSKMYRHDLELYGGKTSVLVDEFMPWFVGLWHGKSLALIVACIAISISFGFFLVADHLRSDLQSDARDGNKGIGTD